MSAHPHPTAPRLSALLSQDVPLVAVSFSDTTPLDDVKRARSIGLDIAEIRIDRFGRYEHDHVLGVVRDLSELPTIATIRIPDEGGSWTGTEDERRDLFKAVLPEVDAIDIELNATEILTSVVAMAKAQNKVVIISHHNLTATPGAHDLELMAAGAKDLGADLVKIATQATSMDDLRTLASFTADNREMGLIVIATGPLGGISRIFFPALGSRLTYAYIHPPIVSGQLELTETVELLRRFYPSINSEKVTELQVLEDA